MFVYGVYAQQAQYCPVPNDFCVAISVSSPKTATNPTLLITMQAASKYKWFAIGFGSQMRGSLMLVVWPNNDKVVVSTRLATYSPPQNADADTVEGMLFPPFIQGPILKTFQTASLLT